MPDVPASLPYSELHLAVFNALRLGTDAARGWMEHLLASGADINEPDRIGVTPLLRAILHRSMVDEDRCVLIRFLLDKGADPNRPCMECQTTPFLSAIVVADIPSIALLLEAGADIQAKDATGIGVMHYAAGRLNKPLITFLLAHGAGINERDSEGRTPLDGVVQLLSMPPGLTSLGPMRWTDEQKSVVDHLRSLGAISGHEPTG